MKISVIIPTYNYGSFLPQSLRSVLEQTLPPSEVIVVDDGSTDDTPPIVKPFLLRDSRITYLRAANGGVSRARNRGLQAARGDLIAFLDADDLWHPDKLRLQEPLFRNPGVGVVYSLRTPFSDKGVLPRYRHVKVFRGNVLSRLMVQNFICTSSAVVRRECLERVGGFDPALTQGEDLDLWLRIAAEGYRFDYAGEPLVFYRQGGSASAQGDKRYHDNRLMLRRFFRDARYRRLVTLNMRRKAWAALWRKRGYMLFEKGNRLEALFFALSSAALAPLCTMSWKVVLKSILPSEVVARLRSNQVPVVW